MIGLEINLLEYACVFYDALSDSKTVYLSTWVTYLSAKRSCNANFGNGSSYVV